MGANQCAFRALTALHRWKAGGRRAPLVAMQHMKVHHTGANGQVAQFKLIRKVINIKGKK